MTEAQYTIHSHPNFPYTESCLKAGLSHLSELLEFLKHLPYQRISNPELPLLVLEEAQGTCSSKHAFIKMLAEEQEWFNVKLLLVLYKMNEENTPGVGKVLEEKGMEYMPEAHTVVEIDAIIHDITFPNSDFTALAPDVLEVREIQGTQAGAWKKNYHQQWIKSWLGAEQADNTFQDIWQIREACIAALAS